MLTNNRSHRFFGFGFWVSIIGVILGAVVGFLTGVKPLLIGLGLGTVCIVTLFFTSFEEVVLGLLVLRSSLDIFSAQQVPAAFAIGLDALTLLYVVVHYLSRQRIYTDKFFWLVAGWIAFQGLWVILLPLGGLGFGGEYLADALREWIRLFSWLMVYLLVMQLQDRISPNRVISILFLGLIAPLMIAALQLFLPQILPPMLSAIVVTSSELAEVSRVRGTLGHANTFATFLLLFIGLAFWKFSQSSYRLPWILLLGCLAFFFVATKALFSLMMLGTFILVILAPKLSIPNLMGGLLFFAIVIILFASTEAGQERLGSIANTPLLNPDIDVSRAILLSKGDQNSFNWRISQWYTVLNAWQSYPIFGYGLGLSINIPSNRLLPHNDYVRALAEGGIVGFTTYLGFFGMQVARLVQILRQTAQGSDKYRLCLILLALLISTFVGMLTENIWSHTLFFFYWWTLFAMLSWDWNRYKPTASTLSERT